MAIASSVVPDLTCLHKRDQVGSYPLSIDQMDHDYTSCLNDCMYFIEVLTDDERVYDYSDGVGPRAVKANVMIDQFTSFVTESMGELYRNVRYSLIGEADSARAAFADRVIPDDETARFLFDAYHGGFSDELDRLLPEADRVADLFSTWMREADDVWMAGLLKTGPTHGSATKCDIDDMYDEGNWDEFEGHNRCSQMKTILGEWVVAYFGGIRRLIDLAEGSNLR